jgi:SAM-dependent methyltransferase
MLLGPASAIRRVPRDHTRDGPDERSRRLALTVARRANGPPRNAEGDSEITVGTPTFDPAKFKATTRERWQEAAEAWDRWGPTLEDWLGPATEAMLDGAGVRAGARVLDVAAGAGGQTLAAARRVGPAGHVLATDLSPAILEYAAAAARSAGLENVETRELDGESLAGIEDESVDAVISRLGIIYFPDQLGALAEMRRVLRPGGRLAVLPSVLVNAAGGWPVAE